MNSQWNHNQLNSREDGEAVRRGGFPEQEIERLTQLRRARTSVEYQRLAFVRWLVTTGK